jgi:hypothetical protein
MALGSLVDSPLQQNPLAGGNDLMAGGGGFETSFNLLQRPDENIERQYFYNKDLNKLFNMPMGVRMAAPKGFESVNKDQYEDFASKGATLQGASMFNDAMGGGYNLDLPRLTSGPNSGQVDRNSPEFLYYYEDQQKKLSPKLSLEGTSGISAIDGSTINTSSVVPGSGSNVPLNYGGGNVGPSVVNEIVPYNPNAGQPIGLDGKPILDGTPSIFPIKNEKGEDIGGIENTAIASVNGPGLQDLVSPATPPTPTIPKLDGTGLPEHNYTRSVQPIVTGPETFEVSTQQAPYQEQFTGFGNQLTGFGDQLTGFNDQFGGLSKQFDTINTRLNSMDEGIAGLSELLQPQQKLYNSPYSNFNFRNNSYSNPSPFGLGSLFGRRY